MREELNNEDSSEENSEEKRGLTEEEAQRLEERKNDLKVAD